jgi:hypothetical protein
MRRKTDWAPRQLREPKIEVKPYRAHSEPCAVGGPGCTKRADLYLDFDARGRKFKGDICLACADRIDPTLVRERGEVR